MKNRLLCLVVAGLMIQIVTSGMGFAQEVKFPTKPIKVIMPFGPCQTDTITRVWAKEAEKILGQPIVCETQTGGGRLLGVKMVADAKPDGYTLGGVVTSAIAWMPLLQKVPYDPRKDFTFLTSFGTYSTMMLSVKSDSPFKTVNELIEYSRTHGPLKFSTPGTNVMHDIIQYSVAKKTGIQWKHVPYTSDIPAITALLGGHVSFTCCGGAQAPFIESGQLIPLVNYSETRSEFFPKVPTWRDLGYPYGAETRAGITGPAGMPKPIVEKLSSAFKKAIESAEFLEICKKMLFSRSYLGPEESTKFHHDQIEKVYKMFKELDLPIVKE